jgi:nicotinate-nucleotide adenylyltransferase
VTIKPPHIGVFGGGFDPPHVAHVRLVETAKRVLHLDRVIVVPTGQAGHKQPSKTPAAHRLAMACLAFAGVEGVEVDDCEIKRDGPSWMVDTLESLIDRSNGGGEATQTAARWTLILGLDQLTRFETWVQWQNIARTCELAVAYRPDGLGRQSIDTAAWREKGVRVTSLPFEWQAVSSSALRAAIAKQGCASAQADWRALVPQEAARYICEHHLYVAN